MPRHPLSQRIADVLDLQPDSQAIEYDGQWISWAQVSAQARRIASLTTERSAEIGMLLRNRPGQVAAFLGVLLGGGTVVVINPYRGDDRTRADIAALQLPLIIGEPDDLARLVPPVTPTVSISGVLDDAGGSVLHAAGPASRPAV
ncbi:MAG: AMP-binding protein, partial [Mycobacterium sp.]